MGDVMTAELIEQQLLFELNSQIKALISNHPFPTKEPKWLLDMDDEIVAWIKFALEEKPPQSLLGQELQYIAPKLFLSVYAAVGDSTIIKPVLSVAAALQILHAASALFDAIQDGDKSSPLVEEIKPSKANNVALIMLLSAQKIIFDAITSVSEAKSLPTSDYQIRGSFHTSSSTTCYTLMSNLLETLISGFRGQLLDLQEDQLDVTARLDNSDLYLIKMASKTGLVYSYISGLGASLVGVEAAVITVYKKFGFAFGVALHLIDDLIDFSKTLYSPAESADLQSRRLTLPFVFGYQELFQSPGRQQEFLDAWNWNDVQPLPVDTTQSNATLGRLLGAGNGSAFVQSLLLATNYVVEAEAHLREVDPELKKPEHKRLIQILQKLISTLYNWHLAGQKQANRDDK